MNLFDFVYLSIVLACGYLVSSVKLLALVQQSGYSNKRAFKWYCRKDNMLAQRYLLLTTMQVLLSLLIGVSFLFCGVAVSSFLTLIPCFALCVLFYFTDKKYALKVPLKETERLKRLALVYYILLVVVIFLLMLCGNALAVAVQSDLMGAWRYVAVGSMPVLCIFVLFLANALLSPYEKKRNRQYIDRAKERLQNGSAIKVGITGSYGKTSVKNILAAMLSEKYKVLATPESYNTPMGIARTVNENTEKYDVFIAEMGARKRGDIAELCEIVQPTISILTGVCEQHVESFGSINNILATKREIIRGTNGIVYVGEDENTKKITEQNVVFIGDENYKELQCSAEGTSFTMVLPWKKISILTVKTKLLGEHTAKNILLAASVALELGVSAEQIVSACERLDYVPHRLQVIHAKNGLTVLDDSYNANIKSVAEAVKVLRYFGGKKVVVTPGIVETGVLHEELNGRLGAMLTGADEVILVGDTLVGAVKKGFLDAGGEEGRIRTVFTLEEAKNLLPSLVKSGDTVLFLNDLPDVY